LLDKNIGGVSKEDCGHRETANVAEQLPDRHLFSKVVDLDAVYFNTNFTERHSSTLKV
jgi:hypothetical protein